MSIWNLLGTTRVNTIIGIVGIIVTFCGIIGVSWFVSKPTLELEGPICEYGKGDFSENSAMLGVVNINKLEEVGIKIGDKVKVTIRGNDFRKDVPGLTLGKDSSLGTCVIRMERAIFKGLDARLVKDLKVPLEQRNDYIITVERSPVQ